MRRHTTWILVQMLVTTAVNMILMGNCVDATFTSLVMMGSNRRRGKKRLQTSFDTSRTTSTTTTTTGDKVTKQNSFPMNTLNNNGQGQEITGVTLPAENTLKGWEVGNSSSNNNNNMKMVVANVNGKFYALQGACPRCAFDLWKGNLILEDSAGWEELPRVACPTCATTYSLQTGRYGPPLKRTGLLAGFVNGLAKTATLQDEFKNAKAFLITNDDNGRIYCKEQ